MSELLISTTEFINKDELIRLITAGISPKGQCIMSRCVSKGFRSVCVGGADWMDPGGKQKQTKSFSSPLSSCSPEQTHRSASFIFNISHTHTLNKQLRKQHITGDSRLTSQPINNRSSWSIHSLLFGYYVDESAAADTWCSHAGSLQLQLRHHLHMLRPPVPLRPASHRDRFIPPNTNQITVILAPSSGAIPATWVRLFHCQYAASPPPPHPLLTVSMLAPRPRCFPAVLRGLPSLLPGPVSRHRAGWALGPGRPAPRLGADSSGKHGDGPAGVCVWGTRRSCRVERRLTLCRHRSYRRPGLAHRSCRSPPLLLLCVGGGGPTRHTRSGFRCP